MKDRPILMTTESVRAILDGRKSQTRRVIKPQPPQTILNPVMLARDPVSPSGYSFISDEIEDILLKCPYGQVGDRLWVRETYFISAGDMAVYKADCSKEFAKEFKWYPSIFMPRWASRITLEITEVRVERLQEIQPEDAQVEGFTTMPGMTSGGNIGLMSATACFKELWDSLNAKRGYGWETNPWVWVISFKVVKNGN